MEPVDPVEFLESVFGVRITKDEILRVLDLNDGNLNAAYDYIQENYPLRGESSVEVMGTGALAGGPGPGSGDVMDSPRAHNLEPSGATQRGRFASLFPNVHHIQEPSVRRVSDDDTDDGVATSMYNILEELLGLFQGVVNYCREEVEASTIDVDRAIIDGIASALMRDEAPEIEGMFAQFDKKTADQREELYFAFRLYMLVQGFCCICHDRLARAVKDFLIGILSDYRVTVDGQANHNLTLLYGELSSQFAKSFGTGSGATISQPTCRLAGEHMIRIFREWLRDKYNIMLDDSVIIHMKTRIATKKIIADILNKEEIEEEDRPLQEFALNLSVAMFDAMHNMFPHKSVGDIGTTSMDAAAVSKDAQLLTFQSCSFIDPQVMNIPTQPSRRLVPTLVPRACLWDSRDDTMYPDTKKMIAPLSMGPVTVVSLLAFDPDIVDKDFMKIVKKNTKSQLWTPVVLMFGLVDHFIKDDPDTQEEANSFYHKEFKEFLKNVRADAEKEASSLNVVDKCDRLRTPVPQYVRINGQLCILISASFGPMSVNMTTNIIKEVIPKVVLGVRGGGGCSKQKISGVVYMGMGQDARSEKLSNKNGLTPLGKIVATIGVMLKQFGDESKLYLLLLIRILTGWSLGMFGTVDTMAATQYALFGSTMLVAGETITVRRPASSLKTPRDLIEEIAELQARFQIYTSKLADKDLYNDLKKKFDTFCKLAVAETMIPAIKILKQKRINNSRLPALISALVFCDVLSCRDSLVSRESVVAITTSPFDRAIHGATASKEEFPSLFLQPNTSKCLTECVGTLGSSLDAHRKQWVYVGADGSPVPECDFSQYVERTIKAEFEGHCIEGDEKSILARYKELIELEGGVFTLLKQKDNFETKKKTQAALTVGRRRTLRSDTLSFDYATIISESLDPWILTILEKYIMENTTGRTGGGQSTSWRDMCLSIVRNHFKHSQTLDIPQDSISLSQDAAERDWNAGHIIADDDGRGLSVSVPCSQHNDEQESPPHKKSTLPMQPFSPPLFQFTNHDEDINMIREMRKKREQEEAAKAAAAAAAAIPVAVRSSIQSLVNPNPNPALQALNRAQRQQQQQQQRKGNKGNKGKGRGGGTRKKSKIQKRKITRRYKGKTSRHNHTIKNRHIRNYSLRNKQ